ncbi:MAG: hypothetical protein ACI4VL_05255 [Bacilli bacterium]
MLAEEYNNYLELISTKEKLNTELLNLSGKKDPNSIKKINDLGAKLGDINNELSKYDNNLLDKVDAYFKEKKEFDRICKEIKTIEDLSKKSTGQKEVVNSAEGRKKKIDKELSYEYTLLAEHKRKLRTIFEKKYREIKEISSIVKNIKVEENKPSVSQEHTYILPKITTYDDLSNEDKIKETKERLERIFATSLLPNQGKKMIVTYDGQKRTIPRKYQGYFNETLKELRLLQGEAKKISPTSEPLKEVNIQTVLNKATSSINNEQLVKEDLYKEILNFNQNNNFNFITPEDEEIFNELFGNCPQNKKKEIYKKLFSEEAIARRDKLISDLTKQIEVEPTFRQTINTAKTYVTSVSQKIKNKISNIGKKVKSKTDELKYEIINKAVNLKENTCQKVSEGKSKICDISKENLKNIQYVFDDIKREMEERKNKRKFSKDELFEIIEKLLEENANKDREIGIYKAKIRKLEENSRGYIATGILTIIGVIALATVIFIIVSNIVAG